MTVSNSSPLIHLSRLGKLGYMMKMFTSLTIPEAVRYETIEIGKNEGYSDALTLERLETEGWLKTTTISAVQSKRLANELSLQLGKGEAEAIALAMEKNERLLIDDQKGRQVAILYGIKTITTLGVIFELLVEGVLDKVDYRRNIKNYASHGWITSEVLQEFLERGETVE